MKINHTKAAARLGFFTAAVLIAGIFGQATQAQSMYRGKFTIDHQVIRQPARLRALAAIGAASAPGFG